MEEEFLFLAGNGFDISHCLPTTYLDFFEFCRSNYNNLLNDLMLFFRHYKIKNNWEDFEYGLSYLNDEKFFDHTRVSKFGQIESAIRYVEDTFNDLKTNLDFLLRKWAIRISDNPTLLTEQIFNFSKKVFFITFNYTSTLEQLYKVPSQKVIHIHGEAHNVKTKLVYGHRDEEFINNRLSFTHNPEFVFENELTKSIVNEVEKLKKPTESIYKSNSKYFKRIYSKIYIFGHSISPIDYYYFKKLALYNWNSIWIIHCHSDQDRINAYRFVTINRIKKFEILNTIDFLSKHATI